MRKSFSAAALLVAGLGLAGCDMMKSITGQAPANNMTAANTAAPAPAPAAPAPATPGAPATSVTGGAQQNFAVVNTTSKTVLTLHVSSVTDQNWGPDILGAAVIAPGATANVTFPRTESQCNWDVRAVYTDGTNTELRGVNLCQVATVTLVE